MLASTRERFSLSARFRKSPVKKQVLQSAAEVVAASNSVRDDVLLLILSAQFADWNEKFN